MHTSNVLQTNFHREINFKSKCHAPVVFKKNVIISELLEKCKDGSMGYGRIFPVVRNFKSLSKKNHLRDRHVGPLTLSLNLGQTRGVLHCVLFKINTRCLYKNFE